MRQIRRVPARDHGVSDKDAYTALGISRATFFRLLRAGVLPEPAPLNGTKRRWWTASDIQIAKDALQEYKQREVR